MVNIQIEQTALTKRLAEVPNGEIFTGSIDGRISHGPFIKIGSCGEALWVVAKLEALDGIVWVSSRPKDCAALVTDFKPLRVRRIVLSDQWGEPVAALPDRKEPTS